MVQDDGTCGASYSGVSKAGFLGSLVQPAAGMGFGRGDTVAQRPVYAAPATVVPGPRAIRSPLDMAVAADMYAKTGGRVLGALGGRGRPGRRSLGRLGSGDVLRAMHASHIAQGRL